MTLLWKALFSPLPHIPPAVAKQPEPLSHASLGEGRGHVGVPRVQFVNTAQELNGSNVKEKQYDCRGIRMSGKAFLTCSSLYLKLGQH